MKLFFQGELIRWFTSSYCYWERARDIHMLFIRVVEPACSYRHQVERKQRRRWLARALDGHESIRAAQRRKLSVCKSAWHPARWNALSLLFHPLSLSNINSFTSFVSVLSDITQTIQRPSLILSLDDCPCGCLFRSPVHFHELWADWIDTWMWRKNGTSGLSN